ncbi:MAG: tetratricopeptide repeat protein [Polyangiaceae bacterium]
MTHKKRIFVSLIGLGLMACGGGKSEGVKSPANASGKKDRSGMSVSKAAAEGFERALDGFANHDRKQDWNDSSCTSVAEDFLSASKEQQSATNRKLPEAHYNAGLAYQRCGKDAEARKQYEEAVAIDSNFHRARAQIALYDYAKSKDIDGTIAKLEQIIRDAKFQNSEALVGVAALQMERNSDQSTDDGKNDLERAQRNLQRALAIDDSFMPAFNQLAVYYLEQAKAKAAKDEGKKKRRRGLVAASTKGLDVNSQQLDLAALVASQALRKNPNYAPIHNTAGLIQVELKNFNGAVKSFGTARSLDPRFFEAHMNYAAVNLSFRGFGEAEKAYRDALKLRPNEFEARLGLALAIRGQIRPGDPGKLTDKAQAELDAARKIDASRPETYYNEAILTQEYRAKGDEKSAIPMLKKASSMYQQFISKAGADPVFADAVKRAKERAQDIDDTVKFIEEGEAAKKAGGAPPAGT